MFTLYFEAFIFLMAMSHFVRINNIIMSVFFEKISIYVFLLIALLFFSYLVSQVKGNDLPIYKNSYNYISSTLFNFPNDYYASFQGGVLSEPGYIIIEELFKKIVQNSTIYIIMINYLCLVTTCYIYKIRLRYYYLAIFLYMSRVLYDTQANGVRIGIASTLMFIGVVIFERNKILSLIVLVLAAFTHESVIVVFFYLVAYVIYSKKFFTLIKRVSHKKILWICFISLWLSYCISIGLFKYYIGKMPLSISRYIFLDAGKLEPTNIFARVIVVLQLYLSFISLRHLKNCEFGIFAYICSLFVYLIFANLGIFAYRLQEFFQIIGFLYFVKLCECEQKFVSVVLIYGILSFIMFYSRNMLF